MSAAKKLAPGFYTMPEAAERLGIAPAKAYEMHNDGAFPVEVVMLGASRKVRIAELEAFLQGSAPNPAPGCPTAEDAVGDAIKRLAAASLSLAEAARDLAAVKR